MCHLYYKYELTKNNYNILNNEFVNLEVGVSSRAGSPNNITSDIHIQASRSRNRNGQQVCDRKELV
jgi:hypothetical protein